MIHPDYKHILQPSGSYCGRREAVMCAECPCLAYVDFIGSHCLNMSEKQYLFRTCPTAKSVAEYKAALPTTKGNRRITL